MTNRPHTFIDVFQEAGAPVILKHQVIQYPVWPSETIEHHSEVLRDLNDCRDINKTLDQSPRELLDGKTLRRLKTLVAYAYNQIPFYKRIYDAAGFQPGDLKSLLDFSALPTVTKSDLQVLYGELLLSPWAKINFKARTSGSTGVPLSLINDTDRQKHWFVKRILMFEDMMGAKLAAKDWTYSVYYEPFFLTSIFGHYRTFTVGLNADPQAVADHIKQIRPKLVTGVGSSIMNIARLLPDAKKLGISAFTTNSEASSRAERKTLGATLGVPILDEYSSEELGIIAWEQRDGTYIVAEDTVHLELVPQGNDGLLSVVGTDLWNFTMPRIRYVQGDFAEWKSAEPEIGLRRLDRVLGRQDMKLISPDFGPIDPARILEIFDSTLIPESAGVSQFRLVQKSLNDIQLLLILKTGAINFQAALKDFETRFSALFGTSAKLQVKILDQLPNLGVKKRCILRDFNV